MVKIDLFDICIRNMAQVQIIIIVRNDDSAGITYSFADGFGNGCFTGTGAASDQD
jgi:hypothetical protein